MAMTLTGLTGTIYQALDTVAREQLGFLGAVGTDISGATVAIGQNVRSAVANASTAADIVPGVTPPNTGGQAIVYKDITISKSRAVPLQWTGEEQLLVNGAYSSILVDQFTQAFRTLANEVETDVVTAAAAAASRFVGSSGTVPFGTAGDLSDFANLLQVLDDNGAPVMNRSLVVDSTAMANIRGKQSVLFKANEAGTDRLLREGIVGRVESLDVRPSHFGTVTHTSGTGANYVIDGAGNTAVGSTVLKVKTGTGTILAGDIITIGGYNYTVTAALSATLLTIAAPGLRAAVADGDTVTVIATGSTYKMRGVAFSKSSIQLLMRAPAMPQGGDAAQDVLYVTDPVSGIVFQIALYKEYRQVHMEVGLAWGQTVFKPEFVVGLLG